MASAVRFSRVCRLFRRTASVVHMKNTVPRPDGRQYHMLLVNESISCLRWKQYGNKRFLQTFPEQKISTVPSKLVETEEFQFIEQRLNSKRLSVFSKAWFNQLLTSLEKTDALNLTEARVLLLSTGKLNVCIPVSKRAEYTRLVWDKLQELGENEVKKSVQMYNLYMKVRLENKDAVIPSDALEEMAARLLTPDQESYHLLTASACETGDMETASELLSEMKTLGMESVIELYNSFIRGFCKAGDTEKAMEMFRFICSHQLKPNSETFGNLLVGYAEQADVDSMKEVLKMANEAGVVADSEKCFEAINILADAGHKYLAEQALSMLHHDVPGLLSYPYLMCPLMSLVHNGHTDLALDLALDLFFKNDEPIKKFYDGVVGAEMEVSELLKYVRQFKNLGCGRCTLKDAILDVAYWQRETEYAVELYRHLKGEGEEPQAKCLIPAITAAVQENDREGLLKLIHLARELNMLEFKQFMVMSYPIVKEMAGSSEDAVKILKEANPVSMEEWTAAMIRSLLQNEPLEVAEKEVEHMEKLKSVLGLRSIIEQLAIHLKEPEDWKRVFEFAMKLRDKCEWYLDYLPLFEKAYFVFLEAEKSLVPVADFLIENNIKMERVAGHIDQLFPNTDLSKEKIEQFLELKSSYRKWIETTEEVVMKTYRTVPYHFNEVRTYLIGKAIDEMNIRELQSLLKGTPPATKVSMSYERRIHLIELYCGQLSDVDAALDHYRFLINKVKQISGDFQIPVKTVASLAVGLCEKGKFDEALYVLQNPKRDVKRGRYQMTSEMIKRLLELSQNNEQKKKLNEALISNNYLLKQAAVLDESELEEETLRMLQRNYIFSLFRKLIQAQNMTELQRVTDILCKHNSWTWTFHTLAAAFVTEHKILQARKTIKASGPFNPKEVKEICQFISRLEGALPMLKSLYPLIAESPEKIAGTKQLCQNEVMFQIIRKIANDQGLDKAVEYIEESTGPDDIIPRVRGYLQKAFISLQKPLPAILGLPPSETMEQKQTDTQVGQSAPKDQKAKKTVKAKKTSQDDKASEIIVDTLSADIAQREEEIKDIAEPGPATVSDVVEREEEIKDVAKQSDSATEIIERSEPVNEIMESSEAVKDKTEKSEPAKESL